MSQFAIIATLVCGVLAALCTLIGVVYTANRKGRTDDSALNQQKQSKSEEASATVKVAVIADRDNFEQRLIARVEALQAQVDKERELRQASEDKARLDRADMHDRIEDYKHKFTDVQHTLEQLQREKVIASKDYQDRITEQDMTNHKLQDQLKSLQGKYDTLQHEYEEVLKMCNELRQELAKARGEAITDVLTLAKSIGSAETPQV